jgi:hypothetical protein
VACELRKVLAREAVGQVKCDRGAGTASAGQNPHPVGYLPNEPQAVAGPGRQRAPRGRAGGIRRVGSLAARVVWRLTWMPGRQRFAVLNLTVQ